MELDESEDDIFLPDDSTLVDDEPTDNISPVLRALMAKYTVPKVLCAVLF
jgi:hypothetical protein